MKKLAWITDPHLEFLEDEQIDTMLQQIRATAADGLLISGDISTAYRVAYDLKHLAEQLPLPIYFVLGNHDFYGGSVGEVRQRVAQIADAHANLYYLTDEDVIELTPQTALIGHDGWGDARLGDVANMVMLNDDIQIQDFARLLPDQRLQRLREYGDEAGRHLGQKLALAQTLYREILVLTHVPPFREACWYEGQISDNHWVPRFTCAAAGDALRDGMATQPDHQMRVLCGHTHGQGEATILPDLRVTTGGADYSQLPTIRLIDVT